jgi:hypothetical protein
MKAIFALTAAALLALASPARSDPVILESFSQSGFTMSDTGPSRAITFFNPTLVNIRDARGSGDEFWTAVLDPSVGIMRYNVAAAVPPIDSYRLLLGYYNNGNPFSIADYTAFYLALPEVTGTGNLIITAGSGGFFSSIAHPIFQPGEIFYNFSLMTGGEWQDPISNLQFYFIPTSNNFSVGVDYIALIPAVPEPCSALLLLTGTGLLAARRRRT